MDTCIFCTPWCRQNCYAKKFYKLGYSKKEWDKKYEDWWQRVTPEEFCQSLVKRSGAPERFRFSVKGEIWTTPEDVVKVAKILDLLPDTLFWIPTRAWHTWVMAEKIEQHVKWKTNSRVMASVDPSDDPGEVSVVRDMGWSMLYVGVNEDQEQMLLGEDSLQVNPASGMFHCPKTWDHREGHCAVCEEGCFKEGVNSVRLRKHR
jgi:hypothetical protein